MSRNDMLFWIGLANLVLTVARPGTDWLGLSMSGGIILFTMLRAKS